MDVGCPHSSSGTVSVSGCCESVNLWGPTPERDTWKGVPKQWRRGIITVGELLGSVLKMVRYGTCP